MRILNLGKAAATATSHLHIDIREEPCHHVVPDCLLVAFGVIYMDEQCPVWLFGNLQQSVDFTPGFDLLRVLTGHRIGKGRRRVISTAVTRGSQFIADSTTAYCVARACSVEHSDRTAVTLSPAAS
jgi:hypothetical protein